MCLKLRNMWKLQCGEYSVFQRALQLGPRTLDLIVRLGWEDGGQEQGEEKSQLLGAKNRVKVAVWL